MYVEVKGDVQENIYAEFVIDENDKWYLLDVSVK